MGSAGFLLIFAAVNAANVVLATETESTRWLSILGIVLCLGALGSLLWQTAASAPTRLWVLAGMVVLVLLVESCFCILTFRKIRLIHSR